MTTTRRGTRGVEPEREFLGDRLARAWRPQAGSGWRAGGLYIGEGNHGIEVAVAHATAAPRRGELMAAWKERRGGRAAPVLLIVLYPGSAALCGASGEQPPIYPEVDAGQVERLCREVMDQPDRHAALRFLTQVLPSLETPLPGLSNEGLLALHELQHGAPTRDDWVEAWTQGRANTGSPRRRSAQEARVPGRTARQPHQPAAKRRSKDRSRSNAARDRIARGRHRAVQQPLPGELRARESGRGKTSSGSSSCRETACGCTRPQSTPVSDGADERKRSSNASLRCWRTRISPTCGCCTRPRPSRRKGV